MRVIYILSAFAVGLPMVVGQVFGMFGGGKDKNSGPLDINQFQGNNSYNIEKRLAIKELERVENIRSILENNGIEIYGFYHTSTWRTHWSKIIEEQLYLLDGQRKFPDPAVKNGDVTDYAGYVWDNSHRYASLLSLTKELFINVAIPLKNDKEDTTGYRKISDLVDGLKLKHRDRVRLNYNRTLGRDEFNHVDEAKKKKYNADDTLSTGEYATIKKLQDFCKARVAENKKTLIYYMHMKGSCCMKDPAHLEKQVPVATWREYMNAMNLEFPSPCIRALVNKKYTVCGVENQDAHYSGNFWWADCNHIARLPPIDNRFDFMAPEFFVLRAHPDFGIARSFGYRCGYSLHNCGVNLYDNECKRAMFREKLTKYVFHKLAASNRNPTDNQLATCREPFKNPQTYYEQQELMRSLFQ